VYFSLGGMVDGVEWMDCIVYVCGNVNVKQKGKNVTSFSMVLTWNASCRLDIEMEIIPQERVSRETAYLRRPLFKRNHFSYLPTYLSVSLPCRSRINASLLDNDAAFTCWSRRRFKVLVVMDNQRDGA